MSYESLTEKLLKGKKDKFFVSIVPVTELGEVLLGKRTEDGIWTTPGGGADPGEEPHEAARRELFEEAGLAAPANALELVSISETPRGFKIYSFLWRMPKMLGEVATSKLDPDKEVKSWKLLRPENFPAAMSEEKNASRLKTIREALMRLYAVKSEDNVLSLIDKLTKGGEGSGIKGHRTPKKEQLSQLHDLGFAAQDLGQDLDPKHYAMLPEPMRNQIEEIKKIADEYHETEEDSPKYPEVEKRLGDATLKFQQMAKELVMKKSEEIAKGGPGSGVKGHMTAKKIEPHVPHPANQQPEVNKVKAHLELLRNGAALPGVHTKSGKPVLTDLHSARAQGYTVEDYTDAMNVHYNMAQKVNTMVEKLKMAGKAAPKEAVEIAKFHEKKMQETMRARDRLESRSKKSKAAQHNHVKKSVTQMGSGLGDRDLDVASFAQVQDKANAEWMERLHSGMRDAQFGDTPTSFQLPKGVLHLAKVDDGLYSGVFTKQELVEDGMLQDHARVRIERQTIPELVAFMMAQEWVVEHLKAEPEAPKMSSGMAYAAAMDRAGDTIQRQEDESDLRALQHKLENPHEAPRPFDLADRIRMLELISKLIG